jgi:hypothetical protein
VILFPTIYAVFWSVSLALIAAVAAMPLFLHVDPRLHWLGGLAAACVNCLLHTSVMIHLVGTGRSIKDALPHIAAPRRDYTAEQTRVKTASYPLSTLCCVLACATAILGGATRLAGLGGHIHGWFAAGLVLANVASLPIQWRLLHRNGAIVGALEEELEAVVKAMEAKGKLPEVMPWQA